MRTAFLCTLAALSHFFTPVAAASDKSKPLKPCTIHSPATDRFFDLNPIRVVLPKEGEKVHKDARTESWHAKGYDYGANFTINFCGPVVEELEELVGIDSDLAKNVSAFYEKDGKQYAIGLENSEPVFRGRKLVLNYTGGSPCPSGKSKRASLPLDTDDLAARKILDDDDEDEDGDGEDEEPHKKKPSKPSGERRKSTIISLLCEKDPLATTQIAFVAASEDECTYFFEARTSAACGGIEVAEQTLGPGGVFGVIAMIAVLVYLVGGCVYQRTVMHQRGWRQIPNYSMWAGISGFFWDMVIILTSSCARLMPSRRGYSRVSLGYDNGRGRGHRNEDENRLIDNLDEEWED